MDLSRLRPKCKKKATKRKGRGTGSGWGKTGGRGNKGAGARSGKVLPYIGFRGGNLPLLRRMPKRGFTSAAQLEYQIVNLSDISQRLENSSEISAQDLKKVNLIKDIAKPVKILGKAPENFKLKIQIKADKFSKKAKEIIEKAGGKVELVVKGKAARVKAE